MDHRPIADYALLSDCRSAALVSSQGSDRLAMLSGLRLTVRVWASA